VETGEYRSGEGPRLALIFPPAMHPTSPPLGLASLKAFAAASGAPGSVRLFDLNLAHYQQALRWLDQGRLKMRLGQWDASTTAREVGAACRFFRGQPGSGSFLDPAAYNRQASAYRSFETVLNGLFDNFARRLSLDAAVPPLGRAYFEELLAGVRAFRPDLAGFSILFSQQLHFALALARALKEAGVRVIFGGATLAVMPRPERLLAEPIPISLGRERRRLEPERALDFLLVGEGETGLAALLEDPGQPDRVPGLVYSVGGRVRANPPRMITDLNQLPLPDFRDLPLAEYHSPRLVLPYLSSRGCCWGRCAFCTHQKTYLAYREEAVDRTVSRLAELKSRHRAAHFALVDEMIHPRRFLRLGRRLIESGLEINYSAYAKPTRSFSRPVLETLARSGARVIMWGLESASQRLLAAMKKGTRFQDADRVLIEADRAGIWNLVFLLFGFPSETREEWDQTLDFIERRRAQIAALSKSRFVLLAGSEVFRRPEEHHIVEIMDRPERDPISIAYDYRVSQGLSQEEVAALYKEARARLDRCGRSPHGGLFRDHLLIQASELAGLSPGTRPAGRASS